MAKEDRAAAEALVGQYVKEKKTDEAVKVLFDLIAAYAEDKNFIKAEALCEKLYDVDPMALTEIVRAGELIEEAKSESLDKQHLEIWSDLYDNMSASEGNALYYSMKSQVFDAGESIMEQGCIDNRLFFINHGQVKAVFKSGEKEIFLKTLGVGDIIGREQFFSATVSTISLIAMGTVKTTLLENSILKKWKHDAPALEGRLYDFCTKKDRIKQELESKGMERRQYSRISLYGNMVFQLLDSSLKPLGKAYKGELADISPGGLSFLIKTSKPDSIRMLLGRRLRVSFELVLKDARNIPIKQDLQVIAVQAQAFDDFSIHLKFDSPMEKKLIQSIKGA